MSFFVTANADGAYDLTTAGYTAPILVFIALLLAGAAVFWHQEEDEHQAVGIFRYGDCTCCSYLYDQII